jgi:hypothetical protein
MALLGELPDVIPEEFVRLLPATLQVPRVAGSHIRALEVAGKNLLEVLPTIDHIPR